MTAHSELVARLEGASEGSRELDLALDMLLNPFEYTEAMLADGALGYPIDWLSNDDLPRHSTSLDAALALAERLGLDVLAIMNEAVEGLAVGGWSSSLRTLVPELARHACIAILKAKGAEQ